MNVEDLIFFNKEGNPINMNWDEQSKLWSSKILFDKNSTDTYKTQAIYSFEKVAPSVNTFTTNLNKFQVFNTNNFYIQPKIGNSIGISNIELVNTDVNYNTKWIYADNIETVFYPGSWCVFKNLNGWHNNDFNDTFNVPLTTNFYTQARKVLAVEKGRIMVYTETNNSNSIPVVLPSNATIEPVNIIEVQQSIAEPAWNETTLNTKLYPNKKISLVSGSENDNIYTVVNNCKTYDRIEYVLEPNIYVPVGNEKLVIELELRTSNIKVASGTINFGFTAVDEIQLPYIPNFLNVGDTIQAMPITGTLTTPNDNFLTILNIDKTTNTIQVNLALIPEAIECNVYLTSNIFKIEQDLVLDNNNAYSLPVTYWTIVEQYKEVLESLSGGFRLRYDTELDELHLISDYTDIYSSINVYIEENSTGTTTPLPVITNTDQVIPIYVEQDLIVNEIIEKNASIYSRQFIFNQIDNNGLSLNINGVNYSIPFDIDVITTISDWITAHQVKLNSLGIIISQNINELIISCEYPNVPLFIEPNFGSGTDYYIKYKSIEFNNIKSQLLITINGTDYLVAFNVSDTLTVQDWINQYQTQLNSLGIIVTNTLNTIHFDLLDPELTLNITYNIGYFPKSGDLSVYETLHATNNSGSIISGNEIELIGFNGNDYYSTGQKIDIIGASKILQNKAYNIIGIVNGKLNLSYQGVYWNENTVDITIKSDFFIRFPKTGTENIGNAGYLKWSWKDTQNPDFFLYDFSGSQLKPYIEGFPEYNGPLPLCGIDGNIELKLNKKPNISIDHISNPQKQQTVFDELEYELPYLEDLVDLNLEPQPLQTFIGYNSEYEGWNKARLYCEFIENVSYTLDTKLNNDDLWQFKDNYVEISNLSQSINFIQLGFKKDQIVSFTGKDITDNKNIETLKNAGILYRISEVLPNKITFTTPVIEETSIKQIPSQTVPFYDINGNVIFENRVLEIELKVMPRIVAYFDVYGESEGEDERHKINLNNRNKNIIKMEDFYIFKPVDIKEKGIDWIYFNRKRKEMLEIYPDIFNYIGSYRSVINAINYFGYNDLIFAEYYQNIDPTNNKFGKLFNLELLNIFDKSTKGWTPSNLSYENLRNIGYKKTNLFSLNYNITDKEGNFVNAYSADEVRIKLLSLKKWLNENIIPIGSKIIDITGKYTDQSNFKINHETYMTRNFNVEEYATPVDFDVTCYLLPVSNGSDIYDISVQFKCDEPIEWYEYKIRTFYIDQYDFDSSYLVDSYVLHNNKIWKATSNILPGQEPGLISLWELSSLESMPAVQILRDFKWDLSGTSFTINKTIDPHFIVETSWHSGYGCLHKTVKTYSVIENFFTNFNI